jgi:hypothetical protein
VSDSFYLLCSLQRPWYSTFSSTGNFGNFGSSLDTPSELIEINISNEFPVCINSYLILGTVTDNVVAAGQAYCGCNTDFGSVRLDNRLIYHIGNLASETHLMHRNHSDA